VAADLRSALRWFFTVPAGSFDLLAVSSCRRHLRNCATCKRISLRQRMLGCQSCHTALLNACLGVWIHAKVVCMAQGPAPLDEPDTCLEARPVGDLLESLASSQYSLQARSNLRRRQQATSGSRSWEKRAHLWYASNRDCCVSLQCDVIHFWPTFSCNTVALPRKSDTRPETGRIQGRSRGRLCIAHYIWIVG
jgi:hypothetical protein